LRRRGDGETIMKYTEQENLSALAPKNETPEIFGKLLYGEGAQAWHIIRLKREILQKFPQLKEKRSSFCYKMIMPRDFKEFKDKIKEMENNSACCVPIILGMYRIGD
jgi:hypothetical protein